MLKPAICCKAEIENALKEYFYSADMMYYTGCNNSYLLQVSDSSEDGRYQWAVTHEDGRLIGYIEYQVDQYSSCVHNFGAFSFKRGDPVMGKELYNLLESLIAGYHRVEFRAVSGNPAVKAYDRFLEKHREIGSKHVMTDVFRDADGNYHDDYIYEFINSERMRR